MCDLFLVLVDDMIKNIIIYIEKIIKCIFKEKISFWVDVYFWSCIIIIMVDF